MLKRWNYKTSNWNTISQKFVTRKFYNYSKIRKKNLSFSLQNHFLFVKSFRMACKMLLVMGNKVTLVTRGKLIHLFIHSSFKLIMEGYFVLLQLFEGLYAGGADLTPEFCHVLAIFSRPMTDQLSCIYCLEQTVLTGKSCYLFWAVNYSIVIIKWLLRLKDHSSTAEIWTFVTEMAVLVRSVRMPIPQVLIESAFL